MRVLLLDFWSDRNRGDAAMQIAMAKLVRAEAPQGSHITIMTAFGANQWPAFVADLDESAPLVDAVVGGLHPTTVQFASGSATGRWGRRLGKLWAALTGVCLLPLWFALARAPLLSRFLPRPWRASIEAIRAADLVIWNGRNFRADSARRELYEVWLLLYNPLVVRAFRRPSACVGASFWPLNLSLTRRFLRSVVGASFFLSAREHSSYEFARELLLGTQTAIELLPDLSLGALAPVELRPSFSPTQARPRRIGLTVVDWPQAGAEGRSRYSTALRDTLARLLEDPKASITVIPQVTYEMENPQGVLVDATRGLDDERVTIISGAPTVAELSAIYGELDLLIATRMHSAIFALVQGTPVVTIPYDEGGKWGIIASLGIVGVDVPYSEVTAERLVAKVDHVWGRRAEIVSILADSLPELRERVIDNVRHPLAMYQQSKTARGT